MGQQLAEPVKRDGRILKNQAFVLGIWNFVFPSLSFSKSWGCFSAIA